MNMMNSGYFRNFNSEKSKWCFFRYNRRSDNIYLKLGYNNTEPVDLIKYLGFNLKNEKNIVDPSYNIN